MAYRETTPPGDAVRSIRVANALADRFRTLLATSSGTVEAMELAIGEAQQLYPEIWRHLDDARRALEAAGRDTSAFDEMRTSELAQLGVTDVDTTRELDYVALIAGRVRTKQVRTATFNVEGARRAREAIDALMSSLPDVDWAALAREEDREIAAAGSLQAGKWIATVRNVAIGVGLVAVGFVVYRKWTSASEEKAKLTLEQKEKLDDKVLQEEIVAARKAAITALREEYETTCDDLAKVRLARTLREDAQVAAAAKIDAEHCVARRPVCDPVKASLTLRIAREQGFVADDTLAVTCQGVAFEGEPRRGFAVVVTGKATDGRVRSLRGLVAEDGERDLAEFSAATAGARIVGFTDLDGDGGDDMVLVTTTRLVVARILSGGFVDIAGPVLRSGCAADATIEADVRDGHNGEQKLLVLTVPDGQRKGCLAAGKHYYRVQDGAVVEL